MKKNMKKGKKKYSKGNKKVDNYFQKIYNRKMHRL